MVEGTRVGGRKWSWGSRGPQVSTQPQSLVEIAARARPALDEAEVGRRTGWRAPPRPVPRM